MKSTCLSTRLMFQLQNLLFPKSTTQTTGVNTFELIPHTTEVSRFNLRVDHKISDQDPASRHLASRLLRPVR